MFIKKLIFDKDTSTLSCVNYDDEIYAVYDCSFNYYDGYNSEGERRMPIPNGIYPLSNDTANDLEYGHNIDDSGAYGSFWLGLDKVRGRGWHGYLDDGRRSMTSGTYGCIRSENEVGVQVCYEIVLSLTAGNEVTAEVTGSMDEDEERAKFMIGSDGDQ